MPARRLASADPPVPEMASTEEAAASAQRGHDPTRENFAVLLWVASLAGAAMVLA